MTKIKRNVPGAYILVFLLLKVKTSISKRDAVKIYTYRQIVDHVYIEAAGDTSQTTQLNFTRNGGLLLERYKREEGITRGVSKKQLESKAFAERMAKDCCDL